MSISSPTPEERVRLGSEVLRSRATQCPHCGSSVLHAVPGRTTAQEIRTFARLAGWPEVERDGWVHPGCYCAKGCFGVMAEYGPVPSSLFLVSAGHRRLEVILRVKELFGVSLSEARKWVDGGEILLMKLREKEECESMGAMFESLGATVRIRF